MKKMILVTGAHGQLGKTIRELYEKNNIDLEFVFVSKEALDITNKDNLEIYFKNNSFDYCINCAAYTNVEQAEKTPETAYKVNAEGVKNLSLICDENDIILIHISTDYVFDGEKETPYIINDETNPINEYGKSKLEGENHIKSVLTKYFIIRTSWLYSKKYGNNFYRTILKKANEGKNIYITDAQKGCPTNTESLAEYIIKLISKNIISFGVHHFSDKEIKTWYDFTLDILKEKSLLKKIIVVKSSHYITLAKRPKNSVLKNN